MSKPGQPFDGSDFEDQCEDCGAAPGQLCRPECPSGYSYDTRQQHAEQIAKRNERR